ncbi:MAG: hypothetical protein ACN2B6_00745 [Rickettsiales bacterium]
MSNRVTREDLNTSNQAMHRMPNPPLRCGFVTGDGGRYKSGEISGA